MFDNIGRDLDPEAARRRATSLFLTTTVTGAALGLALGMAAYTAIEVVPEVLDDGWVDLGMEAPEELPPLPAAPPPPLAGAADAEEPDVAPVPDELVENQTLQDEVRPDVTDAEPQGGTPDGDVNGDPLGKRGGRPGGDPNGETCGVPGAPPCGGNVRVFHHSELEVRKKVQPDYPDSARSLALGDQRCLVTVLLDEEGVPLQADVERCPKVFHDASREAILKWRWYPAKDGKVRVKARTTVAITYRLD